MPPNRISLRCLLLALLVIAAPASVASSDKTAEIMAAYIYNFARFVSWPAASFPAAQTPLAVCAASTDALQGQLVRVHGRDAQGRRMVVRVVAAGEDLSGCHILYLSADERAQLPAWLAAASRPALLTVSDIPGFASDGGMIGLYVSDNRVHFSIARPQCERAGLQVSSRLLALARQPARAAAAEVRP